MQSNTPNVLSFDPTRVIFDGSLVYKWTTQQEYDNLLAAAYHLTAYPLELDGQIKVKVAKVRSFEPDATGYKGRLILDRCPGTDLESRIRAEMAAGDNDHEYISSILSSFIEGCIRTGFGWGEIAPRNMILSDKAPYTLTLVDFEKPANFAGPTNSWWVRSLHGYVLEELSCLLSQSTVSSILGAHTDAIHEPKYINKSDISSGRKRALIEAMLLGHTSDIERYPTVVVRAGEQIMARAARPVERDDKTVINMDYIESQVKLHGYAWYVNFALSNTDALLPTAKRQKATA